MKGQLGTFQVPFLEDLPCPPASLVALPGPLESLASVEIWGLPGVGEPPGLTSVPTHTYTKAPFDK
jgi:hypothetical protein